MLAVNWDNEEADALLPMLAEQWVTVRGFSFTYGWMEKFCKEIHSEEQGDTQAAYSNTYMYTIPQY